MIQHPGQFALRVLKGFRANQGFLLAGAVAYYTLLSIVPLLILAMIVLSHVIDTERLVATFRQYLELVVPGQSAAFLEEVNVFLAHRDVVGGVLLVTLLFFSSLAFTVLEIAMSVIFLHRVAIRRRRFLVSALMPYCYILVLGVGLLLVTIVTGALQSLGSESADVFGRTLSFGGVSRFLLYAIGVAGEILLLTSIYLVMPVGRLPWRHALIGGIVAGLLWEITRHVLVWYFSSLSQVKVVYGSLTTAIVVLLSFEIAAMVLLLGAQVIAEYERRGRPQSDARAEPAPASFKGQR